jgi:zinc protease
MTQAIAALAVLLAASTPALAEKQAPPAAGPARDFHVPAPRTITLANGMRVTFVDWGHVPKATVVLDVRTGNANEAPQETNLADLTANLVREGTTTRTATAISEEAARMGGALDVTVGEDATELASDVLSEFAPQAVALVADVARNPRLPESELARLKADLARSVSVNRTNPQSLALEKFRAVLYPDQPTGRVFATEAQIQGYTLPQVKAFYDAGYGAARAHLYVAGRFDHAAVEAAVRKAFGDWRAGTAASPVLRKPHNARGLHLVDKPGAVQTSILLGMTVVDPSNPDWVPLSVTNTLLGGYFSSRMTANLREQKGYTYSPFSEVSWRQKDAYWAQHADVTTNVTGPALKEIFGEIDRLQSEPPPEAELAAVKSYLAGTFVLRNASRRGIITQLEFLDLHGLPADYLSTYVNRVQAVTPAVIQQMAAKYIDDQKATIVLVGDQKAIADQIKEYAPANP